MTGGSANLAFREDEELKPYSKNSQASLLSASLDDEGFTIPAWKAINADNDVASTIRIEQAVQGNQEDTCMPVDDADSEIVTESMLTASSDVLLTDDLEDITTPRKQSHPPSPSASHASCQSSPG